MEGGGKGGRGAGGWVIVSKSDLTNVLAISGYFKKKIYFIKGFVTPPTFSGGRGVRVS